MDYVRLRGCNTVGFSIRDLEDRRKISQLTMTGHLLRRVSCDFCKFGDVIAD